MNRATKLAVAVGLPVAVLIAASQSAAAVSPPTEPPRTEQGAPIPADFVPLTDDTGTITVMVPGSWTDVSTAQVGVIPTIEASTDREAYNATFDVAGVTYRAAPFGDDTEAAAREYGLSGGCVNEAIEPYDDGVFVGSHLIYTECGGEGSTAEFHVVAANPPDQSFTALLRIQITGPDETPILEGILDTFNVAAAGTTGSSVPASSSLPPVTTASGTTAGAFPPPTGEIPADWTQLVDETQTIAISVPSTWTATVVAPAENADGTQRPWISATTDQALFLPPSGTEDTFSVPGVIYQAAPFVADTTAELEASAYHEQCTPDPVQTYDDGAFTGHIQSFNNCGGTPSRIVQVAANPADGSFTALLLVQLTGQADDAATLDGLLSSFNMVSGASAPTTTAAMTPAAPTTAAPTTTVDASSDPFVSVLQQQLEEQLGLVITDEQGSCLLDNFGDTDPEDVQAVLALLTTCGVDVSDVSGG
jgi:hypothetical protein